MRAESLALGEQAARTQSGEGNHGFARLAPHFGRSSRPVPSYSVPGRKISPALGETRISPNLKNYKWESKFCQLCANKNIYFEGPGRVEFQYPATETGYFICLFFAFRRRKSEKKHLNFAVLRTAKVCRLSGAFLMKTKDLRGWDLVFECRLHAERPVWGWVLGLGADCPLESRRYGDW